MILYSDVDSASSSVQLKIARQIDELLNPKKICHWEPISKPQRDAILCEADTLFYGGTAGGGKTSLLVAVAALNHSRSVIFRRTYPNLSEIVNQSYEYYRNGRYNGQSHTWRFPGNRSVQFSHLQYSKDKFSHQGIPRDFYGFDEITEFEEETVRFVTGWNRSTIPGQRCRKIFTGNPPVDTNGEWVIPYFAPWLDDTHENPAKNGELRWFIHSNNKDIEVEDDKPVKIGKETLYPLSRTFIRATLHDNPFLKGTGYEQRLLALPEHMKRALYYGEFNISREDEDWQLIPSSALKACVYKDDEALKLDVKKCHAIGVDPVRGGGDLLAIAPLQGDTFLDIMTWPGAEIPDGQTVLAKIRGIGLNESIAIGIDVIGVGGSAYDQTKVCYKNTIAVNFSEGSTYVDEATGLLKMVNLRAEAYWRFMEDVIKGKVRIPDDKKLINELLAVKYRVTAQGLLIGSKDDIKKVLKRSPDRADSVVTAWFLMNYYSYASFIVR